jgi:hypothetical protein
MADERGQSWWQTLPGMLTAAAGLITAVTGLVVAIHQIFPGHSSSSSGATASSPAETTAPETTGETPTAPTAARYRVSFPSGQRATFFGGGYVYTVLRASAARSNPGEVQLTLRVRMTNTTDVGGNFWSATFRLLVGGVERAPTNFLDDVIEGHSAGDGDVVFTVPASAHAPVLELRQQQTVVKLPVSIRPR